MNKWTIEKIGNYEIKFGLIKEVGTKERWATIPKCSWIAPDPNANPALSSISLIPCEQDAVYRIEANIGQLSCEKHKEDTLKLHRGRLQDLQDMDDEIKKLGASSYEEAIEMLERGEGREVIPDDMRVGIQELYRLRAIEESDKEV